MEKRFRAGEMILEAGASGNEAYLITSGKVQVFRLDKGRKIILAILAEGQIFGEMSMIDDRPRSASIIAMEDTIVEVFNREEFNNLYYTKPESLAAFLKNVFERLRNLDQHVIELTTSMTAQSYQGSQLLLSGFTPHAKKALGNKDKVISKFPYKIGRKTDGFVSDIFSNNDLYLEDTMPYNVSRNHCALQFFKGKFMVIDRGSTLGTLVNDRRIGGSLAIHELDLPRKKESILALGGQRSQFIFKVHVP